MNKEEQSIRDDLFADLVRFKSGKLSIYELTNKILSCKKLEKWFNKTDWEKDYNKDKEYEALARIVEAQALDVYRGKLIKKLREHWYTRVEEIEKGLDEEYGRNHSYHPNYEAIFDEVLTLIKEEK